LLCKEENVRAGRITAAGKMKETVVATVHRGTMKTMDSSKIMGDRVGSRVDNRQIMVTAKKMEEEGCKADNKVVMDSKVVMDGRANMDGRVNMDRDSVAIIAVNKAVTGASMKDTVACKAALVAMDRKDNMDSRAGMEVSKVDLVNKVDMANSMKMKWKSRIMIRDMMRIMMKTTTVPACKAAIRVKGKTMTMIGILKKMRMKMNVECRAAMEKKRKKRMIMMMTKKRRMKTNTKVVDNARCKDVHAADSAACLGKRFAA
jgi:hypothetical protein